MMDAVKRIGGGYMKNSGVDFVFDKEGAHNIDYHARNSELKAAALAAPYVAKYGKLIAGQKNHEGTGVTTLTFAAPAILNGDITNVGVAVQFDKESRPRAVNVELQNGDKFKLDMTKAPSGHNSRVHRVGEGTALSTKDASTDIISDDKPGVKGKFSAAEDEIRTIQGIGEKSVNDFTSEELEICTSFADKYYKELGVKSPFFRAWFGDWRENDKSEYTIPTISSTKEFKSGKAINVDTGKLISWGSDLKGETRNKLRKGGVAVKYIANIDTIVKNSILFDTEVSTRSSKSKLPGTAFMHHFYSIVKGDDEVALFKLFTEEAINLKTLEPFTRAYELLDIEKAATSAGGVLSENGGLTEANIATVNTISDLFHIVKLSNHRPDFVQTLRIIHYSKKRRMEKYVFPMVSDIILLFSIFISRMDD